MAISNQVTHFGPLLREWRLARRLTQEALAERAEVSTRHLSFLETGRSQASREMTLTLGDALDLPLRERNSLLVAAGFAPVYRETALDAAPMLHVRRALERMLAQQEPYPGIVIDRTWNVVQMNKGGVRLFSRLYGGQAPPPEVSGNLVHALFHPRGLRRVIVDWPTLAGVMAQRLHRDVAADPSHEGLRALRDAVLRYPGVPEGLRAPPLAGAPPIAVAVHVRAPDGGEARIFSILASLGTPLDVTAEELQIELYFPVDDASEAFLRAC
ncbi:MAG: helix-turn-helix domain-containing protein [Nannocystis sp.]|nr:helix-turn-helix domain-containing protein [Nannocystis sp.]